MTVSHLLLVAAGGALGAAGRHMVNVAALRLAGPGFPWGTLTVNVAGSLAMGLLVGALSRWAPHEWGTSLRLFLATGLLGGFTTFSAFSLDLAAMWERGAVMVAISYVVASVLISIFGLFLGLWLMRGIA